MRYDEQYAGPMPEPMTAEEQERAQFTVYVDSLERDASKADDEARSFELESASHLTSAREMGALAERRRRKAAVIRRIVEKLKAEGL